MGRKFRYKHLEPITIGDMVAEGKCIARYEDKVIMVEGAVPGDVVKLRITKSHKNYDEAQVLQILEPSAYRKKAFCSHFGTCGGCKWQNLDYDTQLIFKEKQVTDAFERIGRLKGFDREPILPAPKTTYYRNKLEYTFSSKRWLEAHEINSGEPLITQGLGFHIPKHFDKVVQINECFLQVEPSNAVRKALYDFATELKLSFYDLVKNQGMMRNLIIRTANTGQIMVIVQFGEWHPQFAIPLMEHLAEKFPQVSSLNYIVNTKWNETYFDQEVICFKGQPYIEERLENLTLRIRPKSFYQTNSEQALSLYTITREWAGLTGQERVYDLYSGIGSIALFVANRAKEVIGIESVEMAVEDAKVNAQLNGIDHCHFFAGDMKDVIVSEKIKAFGSPDVVITDPPRAGMHPDVVKRLIEVSAPTIVYVSCNPATQARDLQMLSETYEVKRVRPVDMFPHTHHIESVALLQLKQ